VNNGVSSFNGQKGGQAGQKGERLKGGGGGTKKDSTSGRLPVGRTGSPVGGQQGRGVAARRRKERGKSLTKQRDSPPPELLGENLNQARQRKRTPHLGTFRKKSRQKEGGGELVPAQETSLVPPLVYERG